MASIRKRAVREKHRIVTFSGGPWDGKRLWASETCITATMVFRVGEWRGRYVGARWEDVP